MRIKQGIPLTLEEFGLKDGAKLICQDIILHYIFFVCIVTNEFYQRPDLRLQTVRAGQTLGVLVADLPWAKQFQVNI